MNIKLYGLVALLSGVALSSCTDTERIEVQKPYTYDDTYFENIRAFKKTKHEVSYAYYAAWSPVEGAVGYKDPASLGERIIGLPDSIDIVNLWMGVPTAETHPIAYKDMKYCQEKLGTRFVMHADASNYNHDFTVDGVDYSMGGNADVSDEMMAAYAKWIMNTVNEAGLNGVDIDYEGWSANNIYRLVQELGKYWGPKGSNPDMLLIVDYFVTGPGAECEPYCDYFVQQAYSDQVGFLSPSDNYPIEKQIFCEQFGKGYGASGHLILDYARWEKGDGTRKGGCGAYYLDNNFDSNSGIPYNEFRQAIQIMNPAVLN
jgi:hypothetical protein